MSCKAVMTQISDLNALKLALQPLSGSVPFKVRTTFFFFSLKGLLHVQLENRSLKCGELLLRLSKRMCLEL